MSAPGIRPVPAVLIGLLVDLVDLSLSGPLGTAGAIVAAFLVWWLAGHHGTTGAVRVALTAGAALYCLVPLTDLVPLGTAVGAVTTLAGRGRSRATRGAARGPEDGPTEVD